MTSTDKMYARKKIALLLGHEDFNVLGFHFGTLWNGEKAMFINIFDESVNAWAEVQINLATGKTEISNS